MKYFSLLNVHTKLDCTLHSCKYIKVQQQKGSGSAPSPRSSFSSNYIGRHKLLSSVPGSQHVVATGRLAASPGVGQKKQPHQFVAVKMLKEGHTDHVRSGFFVSV